MQRLRNLRARRLNSTFAIARLRRAVGSIEPLEDRRLLSAAVVSQIPTQTLSAGQSGSGVNLSTYLKDTALTGGTVIEMQTPLGNIPLQLTNSQTPLTVANFERYISNGEYVPTIIQRSAPGFVLQGGGTKPDGSNNASVASLNSEAGISNTTGTIAMALSTGPNSATNQWFINLGNNSSVLDGTNDGGPFTVFGNVIDNGMAVANAISQLPIIDGSAENPNWYIGTNDGLPVVNYSGAFAPATVPPANLVTDNIVTVPANQTVSYAVSTGDSSLVTGNINNGVLTLSPHSATASGSTTVTVTATDLSGGTASSTFTVNVHAAAVVSTSNASATAAASGQSSQVVFPITLSAASDTATTLNYTLTPGTAPSGDFQATGSSITIPAGSTQASIPVTILHDSSGGNETFSLNLSALSSNAIFSGGGSTLTVTGTIHAAAVNLATTTTTLAVSSPVISVGHAATFTATVVSTGAAPTGTVTFSSGNTTLGTVNVTGTTAVLTTDLATAGTESVTATYNGNNALAASTSTAVAVQVGGGSSTSLTASSTSIAFGAADTFTATVTPAVSEVVATGTVSFFSSGVALGTVDLVNNIAALSVNLNAQGAQSVTAVYNGDPLNQTSTSAAAIVTVGAPSTLVPTIGRAMLATDGIAGQPFRGSIAITVENTDAIAPQAGVVKVNVYATIGGVITPDSAVIAAVSRKASYISGRMVPITVSIKSLPASLAAGNYTVVAQATDTSGALSGLAVGPSVTVAAPTIALSETFVKLVIPPAVVAGSKTSAVAVLRITNGGNILSSGITMLRLYASPDGTAANGTLIRSFAKKLSIRPHQSINLSLPLGAFPLIADGNYSIVAQVTDPRQQTSSVTDPTPINIAAAKIDLVAQALTLPASTLLNKTITVSLLLGNAGNIQAVGKLNIAFSLSSSANGANPLAVGTVTTGIKLLGQKTQLLHLRLKIPAGGISGQAYLVAVVDPTNSFNDVNTANNTVVSQSPILIG